MSNSLFITGSEAESGKSTISLGVMEMLLRNIDKVAFFRPLIDVDLSDDQKDSDIYLLSSVFNIDIPYRKMYGFTMKEAKNLFSHSKRDEIIEGILKKYHELAEHVEFVFCEGTDFAAVTSAFEFNLNAHLALNLGSPVLLVGSAYQKSVNDAVRSIEIANNSLHEEGCNTVATIVNHVDPGETDRMIDLLKESRFTRDQLIYAIPEKKSLGHPTVGDIAKTLEADVLYGEDQLNRHVYGFTIAAMQLQNFFPRIKHNSLIITPGDRTDVIVACLAAVSSMSMDTISGIVLTGGLIPDESISKLIRGFPRMVPILSVKEDTFPTVRLVDKVHAKISPGDKLKIVEAITVFENNVNILKLGAKIITTKSSIVTPKMFEYELIQKAKAHKQHIVLSEGEEERILRAAEILLRRDVVTITLLGNEQIIRERISQHGFELNKVNIINPLDSNAIGEYVQTYYELRKHKGITEENARDTMGNVNYFGTLMIYKGHADGMVSGSVHSTADTIRPAFEFIKTKPRFSIVSSVFLMCLHDRVLVYGDCAVNPNPNAQQLAEIALSSAETAQTFGIEPRIAMLSYSTGESGKGEDVVKVREATNIAKEMAKERYPYLKIEGPIQYDAAIDSAVANIKMPDSKVAGKATVFIFPDLNTGNNTYKAVQQSAGAVAIGPVLQGLNHPVNDLSRGCTVSDIVNTVAITAIQAQSGKGLL